MIWSIVRLNMQPIGQCKVVGVIIKRRELLS